MPRHPSKPAPIFGKNMALYRKKCGLTQPQLAEMVNMTPKAIDYYERRAINPNAKFVQKVADVLGTTPNILLEYKNSKKVKPGPPPKILTLVEKALTLPKAKQNIAVQFLETLIKS